MATDAHAASSLRQRARPPSLDSPRGRIGARASRARIIRLPVIGPKPSGRAEPEGTRRSASAWMPASSRTPPRRRSGSDRPPAHEGLGRGSVRPGPLLAAPFAPLVLAGCPGACARRSSSGRRQVTCSVQPIGQRSLNILDAVRIRSRFRSPGFEDEHSLVRVQLTARSGSATRVDRRTRRTHSSRLARCTPGSRDLAGTARVA
jgi:hypothetical protein